MKKTLLVVLFAFLALFLMGKAASAQTLYFCEGVSDNGKPITPSSTFNIPSGGGYFYFLVKLPYEIGCYSVNYEIYKENSRGQMVYNTTILQDDMQSSWTWFWKKVTFYETGYYRVDVVDCYSNVLTSSYVTIKWQ
jgi:hypothetical protein